ncbi:MAG: hypothetical protein ACK5N0_15750 [Synechococcaceae cyanobacterium]
METHTSDKSCGIGGIKVCAGINATDVETLLWGVKRCSHASRFDGMGDGKGAAQIMGRQKIELAIRGQPWRRNRYELRTRRRRQDVVIANCAGRINIECKKLDATSKENLEPGRSASMAAA